jgi:RNA polymerase sporulation-specific sigma factor
MKNKQIGFYLEHNLPKYNPNLNSEVDEKTLIINNIRLVRHIINKRIENITTFCEGFRVTYDDVFSAGIFGLIKAARTFNVNKKVKFATYASKCIYNEIGIFIRKNIRTLENTNLEVKLKQDVDGNELKLVDILQSFENEIEDLVEVEYSKKLLDKLYNSLKPREREIIKLFFEDELTQKDVAEQLRISQSYISRIITRILKKAKQIHETLQVS